MLARQTHMSSLALIRKPRLLECDGRVLVRPGDHTDAATVIARAPGPSRHHLIDVAGLLGTERGRFPNRLMQRQVGDYLEAGDILARQGGMLQKIVRTPIEGKVVAVGGGQVMLETPVEGDQITAGFPAVVKEIIPDRGAVLETSAALLQGLWGNGRLGHGQLVLRGSMPDEPLAVSPKDETLKGCVIVSGTGSERQSFLHAQRLGIAGLVLGSMSSGLIDLANSMPYPIIVLDGFGKAGMNVVAYRIFQFLSQQMCYLLAERWDTAAGRQPECIIPQLGDGQKIPVLHEYLPGQYVRINCQPYIGQSGILTEIIPPQNKALFGRQAMTGIVKLESQQAIQVPLANLDILE